MKTRSMRLLAAALLGLSAACAPAPDEKPTIGLLLGTLKEDRWVRDRDFFVAEAEKLGAQVVAQSANNDDATQIAQAEELLRRGVDVLVVVPNNARAALAIVEAAHREKVPVVSYDRLINGSDVDLYVTTDPVRVGELQAEYLVRHAPTGNYLVIGGAPSDNNSRLYREGQMRVLKPLIDQGKIRIVADEDTQNWEPTEALRITERALEEAGNQIIAVLAPNDGTASGAIQALEAQGLAGKVWVTGQDADLAAAQRILAGTQSMTVYKQIPTLAREAARIAVSMARREGLPEPDTTIDNGFKAVPSILIPPVAVDRDNLRQTVVADGFLDEAAVFGGAK